MKIAVVVVGSHFTGKSKTINQYLKPMLGMRPRARFFVRKNRQGVVLSQSFEESGRDLNEVIARYAARDLIVLPARPESEISSRLLQIESVLSRHGFQHSRVPVNADRPESYYEGKAKQILKCLDA